MSSVADLRTVEEELRYTQGLLRTAIDSVPGWVALLDRECRYVVANQKYSESFGKPLIEIVGRVCWEVLPELIPVHKPLVEQCLAGKTVTVNDVLFLDPARPTHIHGVYRPVFGPDGTVEYLSCLVLDITDRVEAEEALRRSDERLRQVTSLMEEAVGIRDAETFEAYYMTPAYEALTGRTVASLLADQASWLEIVHEEDREAVARMAREGRHETRPLETRFRIVRPDGEIRWAWTRAVPILGEEGRPRLWVTSTKDVTDWKRAEDALIAEKERLAVTLASIGDGVLAADTQGRVMSLNVVAEGLTGWTAAEAVGRPLTEVLDLAARAWRPGGADLGVLHGRHVLTARDGRLIPIEHRATPMRDPEGGVLGEVIVIRDISESIRREDERIKAQKLESLSVLAGGIAHDFNNLLTGIQGNLSLALSGPDLPTRVRGWLEDAVAAGERSQGLTQQLLTFARGGAPVCKVVDLRDIVRQAATFASRGSQVACRVDVAPDLWLVVADVGQIGQVVQNLVLNAIEATPGGGEVRVECTNVPMPEDHPAHLAPGPHVCLRVVDHGSGISEEVRARIFDPYFSTKKRRSGLGLAISHSIVVRHGGRILVHSTPGEGATFEVYLPAAPDTPQLAVPEEAYTGAGGGSVLVMDDDAFVRRVCERTLSFLGCRVATASDGREAVDLYRQARREGTPFDLVLMDLTVPGGLGGVEAMAALRELDPDVRAIVMSGYSDNPVLSNHARYGFIAVLPKPFTVERLQEAVAVARRPR